MKIPFNKPAIFSDSYKEITTSIESGNHSGRGPYTKKCEKWFRENNPDISGVFLSTSCTDALEAAAILLDLKEGDEVIVPSYTFVTTALSFFMHGATIRFCDIRKDTLNINENLLESHISKKTKAIVLVHYAGIACEMDAIMNIANKYNLFVIEDNAHGLFGKYKGRNLGSIGNLSTHSFHETKNITCGEGGALFVRDKDLIQRSEIIFEKGTNRSQFINGQVDKYSWDKMSSWIKINSAGLVIDKAIGSGGNINKMASILGKKKGQYLSYASMKRELKKIKSTDLRYRIVVLGMRPDRADVIEHASNIYLKCMKWVGARKILVPQSGLADGVIEQLYKKYKLNV